MSATDDAKKLLQGNGFVVLREKSYRQAQERQRVAEALREAADRDRENHYRWMQQDIFPEERRLRDRCTYLYGLAARHGATDAELRGDVPPPDGWTAPPSLILTHKWDGYKGEWIPVDEDKGQQP